jgi:KipI family sensor histidine kinase inhibitor
MAARVLPYGERAVLVELDSLRAVLDLHAALTNTGAPGAPAGALDDAVPGARTLLVVAASPHRLAEVRTAVERALADVTGSTGQDPHPTGSDDDVVVIEVRYDGEDLDEVARATAMSRDEVVQAHTGQDWVVGFAGFAPGFAYLVGGDPRLRVPRRSTPRARVPEGAVGLAGEFSGIYPRVSPGGWQLIGSTDARLWDADRTPPALLLPGRRVRFVRAEATS